MSTSEACVSDCFIPTRFICTFPRTVERSAPGILVGAMRVLRVGTIVEESEAAVGNKVTGVSVGNSSNSSAGDLVRKSTCWFVGAIGLRVGSRTGLDVGALTGLLGVGGITGLGVGGLTGFNVGRLTGLGVARFTGFGVGRGTGAFVGL